jgi:hypothetical protein
MKKMELEELSRGFFGITPSFGSSLAEAGAVCFYLKHEDGVELHVSGNLLDQYRVYWKKVTPDMIRTWGGDIPYTTEHAAYGVAFLLIRDVTQFKKVERARRGTGFDYWLKKDDCGTAPPFQDAIRLEVSGIFEGDASVVRSRIRRKWKQMQAADPQVSSAFIVVIEFGTPIAQVEDKCIR